MAMKTEHWFGSGARALPGAGCGVGLAACLLLATAVAAPAAETKTVNTRVAEVTSGLRPVGSLLPRRHLYQENTHIF